MPAVPATGAARMPHGDHNPHFGGVVLMNGDLHFEVVARPSGHYNVYFSDAARTELPASMASAVSITITRPGQAPERVALQIDDAGESWVGAGQPVERPDATVRVAYTFQGKPYWIDLPFAATQAKAAAPSQP